MKKYNNYKSKEIMIISLTNQQYYLENVFMI